MELVCIGLSHKTAPLGVRERLALTDEVQAEVLKGLGISLPEAMLISTCNRVEFYVAAATVDRAREVVRAAISQLAGHEALGHLYERHGDAALLHLFRVAGSLESMVLGEPQILGQVKDAFELAQRAGTIHGEIARACAAAFVSAKRVRTETGIGRAATSMASAAVEMAKKVFGGLGGKRGLVVGVGEMSELAARHLRTAGASELWVSNRTFSRAQELAEKVGAQARELEQLPALLVSADVVITSTASPRPIFTREVVAAVLKPRRHRPLVMVDLAVPRDIEPSVNELDGVYAFDVDDIQRTVEENAAARAAEAARAEGIIHEELTRFIGARAVRDGLPVIAQLRMRAEQIARAEALRTLSHGEGWTEKQRKSVEAMALAIVNKLLHTPTARLRTLGVADEGRLSDATAQLFGLEDDDSPGASEAAAPGEPAALSKGSGR